VTATDLTPVTTARTAQQVLAWSRATVEPALRTAVGSLPASMRRIAGYHFGWWDERGEPVAADSGKALRPALVLLCATATGGSPERAVPAAVAVELVHNFSLLHDDVMDGDQTRRHRPTAWTVFGSGPAILAGDALLALALDTVATTGPAVRLLTGTVQRLLDGQNADLDFEERVTVDLAECRQMAEDKTAALLGCACALGGWFGGGWSGDETPHRVENLRAYGEKLGLAFQLVDDLLGIWGDPRVTGKPVHSDLRSMKKTFPVVAALTSGTAAGRELVERYGGQVPPAEADLHHVAGLIERAGGRAWSQQRADDLLAQAMHHLAAARPREPAGAELAALGAFATRRDR
jgi:geranylgeranyl diphosphate synthase type I